MSKFSGKCDFYDGFVMIDSDGEDDEIIENIKKLKLYIQGVDDRSHLVKSDNIKDICKYYPYLEKLATHNRETGYRIYLSDDSFIDIEEKQYRDYIVADVMKYWRKCKKNKVEFKEDECLEALWWTPTDELKEIIHRVAIDGKKAEFDDIHFSLWEHNRRKWFEELVKRGYTENEAYNWCFKGLFDTPEEVEKRLGRPLKEE